MLAVHNFLIAKGELVLCFGKMSGNYQYTFLGQRNSHIFI